ncbi:DCP2-domain-containing protein [Tuber magnatum]|uniref:DCP2-domain-containing protein n=1 Tax=Tuber magnatum TaxID=42249 RepID=A0A317T1Y8_9PEZI|nr:DCP2-domain-containing protein [Tuber magnatum]
MDLTSSYIFSNSTLVEILDDLCVRFIINLPEEELSSIERICFQIEEAQWYFEDFIRETNPTLPTLPLRAFLNKIFAVCPLPILKEMPPERAENAFAEFMAYKTRVPVRGAILLNSAMDKCVLVKGWKSGASWSFPRGKINKDERDEDCAAREVLEETGYDVEGRVHSDHFVEVTMREQNMRLYIVPGVPEETKFEPRTRKEISKIAWHYLSDLPTFSKKKNQQNIQQSDVRNGKYYMVAPFLKELRKWISTSGRKWLEEQKQIPSPVTLISDETEIEEEISPPRVVDSSAELRNLLGIPHDGAAKPNGNYNTTGTDEATARLKNFLNLSGPVTEPADASSKLKSLLNGGGGGNNAQITEQPLEPNPQTLLSILQSGCGPSNSQPTPTPSSLPQPMRQDTPSVPTPVHHSPTGPTNNLMGDFHSQIHPPHPPSPPPTSSFLGPHQMCDQLHNQPHPPKHLSPHRQFSQPAFPSHHHGESPSLPNGPPGWRPPPTSLDALIPPPVPSKPPDPGQAVTLLSILKSAAPAPPATPHTPPPARAANPSPIPSQSYHQQGQQTKRIGLQTPPPLKTSRSQHKSNLLDTLRASATDTTRPAPATPIARYDSPPRYMTSPSSRNANVPARPVHSTSVTPQINRFPSRAPNTPHTPVPVSTTPQPANFDRRQSVSNEQQRALLAIFTNGVSTPHQDPAIISSPEEARPITPKRSRTTSFARRVIPMSPLSREKDGLLAYLETVAKEGGQ